MLECVANVSEGRDREVIERLGVACGSALLDLHTDPHHNRSVLTMAGTDTEVQRAVRALAQAAVELLDLGPHEGAHPRFGVLDVVPFVPLISHLGPTGRAIPRLAPNPPLGPTVAARNRFAQWAGDTLLLPCFLFGPLGPRHHRTLPTVRKDAFSQLKPDFGPDTPHPTAGACAVGARHFLVAYNLLLTGGDRALATAVAAEVRGPAVRALGINAGGTIQVSCNLVDARTVGPADVYDQVAARLEGNGVGIARCELVGLLPKAVLEVIPEHRWPELGLGTEVTIEARMEDRGVSWR
jgi:glutamate formiminotransferase / 5-formyltetrahydrofolate cyclo-ligase